MMNIWEATKTALTGLGLPMAANQMMVATGADYPDAFLVYQLIASPSAQHANNLESLRRYRMQVSYFARSGLSSLPDIDGAMTAAGFTRFAGHELAYNQETRHYGLALEFYFLDEE